MTAPRELLVRLLDYIKEQANPQGYKLVSVRGLVQAHRDIAGLPGVEFDLRVEGDHIWLRIPRLAAEPPPKPPSTHREALQISLDPDGAQPSLNETSFLHRLNQETKDKNPKERARAEMSARAVATRILESYSVSWKSWAESERPRRKTIALYGDFSLSCVKWKRRRPVNR